MSIVNVLHLQRGNLKNGSWKVDVLQVMQQSASCGQIKYHGGSLNWEQVLSDLRTGRSRQLVKNMRKPLLTFP